MVFDCASDLGLSHSPGRDHLEKTAPAAAFLGAVVDSCCRRPGVSRLGVVARAPVCKDLGLGIDQATMDAGRAMIAGTTTSACGLPAILIAARSETL